MRLIRAVLLALVSAIVAATVTYIVAIRPKIRAWGLDPADTQLPLPGDDLIPEPSATETRGISISAPPASIWPWLVQMGYERGGWYSYDALDQKHPPAEAILPEFQSLDVGQIVPFGVGSGFRAAVVEPERALVFYLDAELARKLLDEAIAEGKIPESSRRTSFPEFAVSWSFFLKPTDDGQTRLIERLRVKTPGNAPVKAIMGEIMGTGIVLMTRKQMLGIKERVERPQIFDPLVTPVTPPVDAELESVGV
jgi:proline iminopeptidase